ncbi:hypothetical protein BVC80_2535g1 [Macleaya cordata]|uniref:Uncharacterized protein n=1 Tax=Macleaya cordata TaxID=56857 RepID=A0A200PUY6_MACCD|nr:hypothetical protein BVC80_2535g1 [Macleaya cordata]
MYLFLEAKNPFPCMSSFIITHTDSDQQVRSPLTERLSIDPVPLSPSVYNSKNHLSPHILPPLKFHSGLLGPHITVTLCLDDDDDDDEESVASVSYDMDDNYSDVFEEEGLGSSDTDFSDKPSLIRCYNRELFGVESTTNLAEESINISDRQNGSSVNRGSKENLRIDVPGNIRRFADGDFSSRACSQLKSTPGCRDQPRQQVNILAPHVG